LPVIFWPFQGHFDESPTKNGGAKRGPQRHLIKPPPARLLAAAVQATPLGPGAVKRVLSELKNLNDTSAAGIHVFPSEALMKKNMGQVVLEWSKKVR